MRKLVSQNVGSELLWNPTVAYAEQRYHQFLHAKNHITTTQTMITWFTAWLWCLIVWCPSLHEFIGVNSLGAQEPTKFPMRGLGTHKFLCQGHSHCMAPTALRTHGRGAKPALLHELHLANIDLNVKLFIYKPTGR